jgi:hypothetical protein
MEKVTRQHIEHVRYVLRIPLRTASEANMRSHWSAKAKRVASQRAIVTLALGPCPAWLRERPRHVRLTRIAPRRLDGDNLQSSFKAVRDAVAAWLGIDDGDDATAWLYGQERGEPLQYAVTVEVW